MPAVFVPVYIPGHAGHANITEIPFSDAIQKYPFPYGTIGFALNIALYYAAISTICYQRSPMLLQPLQYPRLVTALCSLSSLTSFALFLYWLVASGWSTLALIGPAQALFPAIFAFAMAFAIWLKRKYPGRSRRLPSDPTGLSAGLIGLYLIWIIIGMSGVGLVAKVGWNNIITKVACFIFSGTFGAIAAFLILAYVISCHRPEVLSDKLKMGFGLSVALFVTAFVALFPLLANWVIAGAASNAMGMPLAGAGNSVIAVYLTYCVASLLPLLSI